MDVLNTFSFPPEAREHFERTGLVQKTIGPQVSVYESVGHDAGLAYRFFTTQVVNKIKSEEFDFDIPDSVEMIEWFKDRGNRPTERVRFLPPELLRFSKKANEKGEFECIGGAYKEAYINFKQGLTTAGLSLTKWGEATESQCFTLHSAGIFTVQQFAAMPRDRVEGRFPKDILDLFEKSIRFVNGQKPMEEIHKYADQVAIVKQENAKLKERLEKLMEDKELKSKKKKETSFED